MTEEEIKEFLRQWIEDARTHQPTKMSESSAEGLAHELYAKLFTAPSDLRVQIINEIRSLDWATRPVSGLESRILSKKIHSLIIQAGWKNPEQWEEMQATWARIHKDEVEKFRKELHQLRIDYVDRLKKAVERVRKEA